MDLLHDARSDLESLWIAIASAERDPAGAGIAVWRCALPRLSGAQLDDAVALGWLTDEERAEASRKVGGIVQSRFGSRRILRRLIVASSLGTSPAAVRLESRCLRCGGLGHGAPSVVQPEGTGLHMSTSSFEDTTVIALGPHAIGVDVEGAGRVDDVIEAQLARASPAWRRVVEACGSTASTVEAWTAFEALGKVTGRGLLASEQEIERALQEHRLSWITDRPGSVVCVATAAAESAITLVDVPGGGAG